MFAAVVVPDWLTTCSTSWRFCRTCTWLVVFSEGTPPAEPLSVYSALITPNTLPPCDASFASVCRKPRQPLRSASSWPCVSWPRTNLTATSLQSIDGSSGSVTVTLYSSSSPKENRPPSSGPSIVIVGVVLPLVMIVLVDVRSPEESITVSTAVKRPRCV